MTLTGQTPLSGAKLLVVDDDDLVLRFMSQLLTSMGADIETAVDFYAAEAIIKEWPLDVAFVDINLPNKDGMELLRHIRKVAPAAPVILITGFPTIESASGALRLEAYDYLTKPVSAKELVQAATRAWETRRLRRENRRMEEANRRYRKQLEKLVKERTRKLGESESRYKDLFDRSRDAILITAPAGKIISCNAAGLELFGYSREEIASLDARQLYADPDDRIAFQQALEQGGFVKDYEVRMKRRDGEPIYCLLTSQIRRDAEGHVDVYQGIIRDITERKRAETTLRHQNEFLTSVLESLTHPFYVIDAANHEVIMANSAAKQMMGNDATTCHGLTHRKNTPCSDDEHPCPLKKVIQAKRPVTVEHLHLDAYGNPRHFEIHGHPIFDKSGDVIHMIEYSIDITDRIQAQKALLQNEAKFRDFFDNSPFMMFSFDAQGHVVDVNRQWQQETGYKPDEVIGRPLERWVAAENGGRTIGTVLTEFWQQHRIRNLPLQFRKHGGEKIHVLLSCNQLFESGGQMLGLAVAQNVTAHRQAQQELQRLKAAIEQSSDGILITNPEGIIQYANPALENVTGFARENILGRDCRTLWGDVAEVTDCCSVWEALAHEGRPWEGHFTNRRRDGSIYEEECAITPIRDEENQVQHYVFVKRDITERKRLETIAEAANLMENIGFVFSGIRHELGNPVNTIKMTLSVLEANLEAFTPIRIREFINRTVRELDRVEYLLKTLKNFSLFENPSIISIRVDTFVESLLSLVEKDMDKRRLSISTVIDPAAETMRIDPRALQQVMLNLLVNAADALEGVTSPRIRIAVSSAGEMIRIVVEDNGQGISTVQQKNLFKPFYTTKPFGTGLGLVIVKKMLVKMNSTIEVISREGRGTTVILTLPGATDAG
jgi:PAS domain S-box-containing protein